MDDRTGSAGATNGEWDAVDVRGELVQGFAGMEFSWLMLTPFPGTAVVGGTLLGAVVVLWALFDRPYRRGWLLAGLGMMLVFAAFWPLVLLVALYALRRRRTPGWQRRQG